jgi:hypothetical protein
MRKSPHTTPDIRERRAKVKQFILKKKTQNLITMMNTYT